MYERGGREKEGEKGKVSRAILVSITRCAYLAEGKKGRKGKEGKSPLAPVPATGKKKEKKGRKEKGEEKSLIS